MADPTKSSLTPRARIGLEYKRGEGELCVYIKCFTNLPLMPAPRGMLCVARAVVLRQVKRGWIPSRRFALINIQETNEEGKTVMETLSVPRRSTVVFNEFFTCPLPSHLFHQCAMRLQFCHVHRDSEKRTIAETDYWIDENPIERFTEYDIPLRIVTPDLGEAEIALCYLPTCARLSFTLVQLTNLALLKPATSKVFACVHVLVCGRTLEKRRTVDVDGTDCRLDARFVFDVSLTDYPSTILVLTVLERLSPCMANDENRNASEELSCSTVKQRKWTVGRVLLGSARGLENTHWVRMLNTPREKHIEVHKLTPC